MERKLVTLRTVKSIEPIDGADMIEIAHIDGWQCVVKKGEFKEGDDGFYFEIDSFLPIRPEFEFLRKGCYKKMGDKEGFRLKTIKLRGALSQGLLLPTNQVADMLDVGIYEKDQDYAELLGVIKYDPPINPKLAGEVVGNFPTHLCPKTDQERIQNLPDWFDKYADVEFEATEKLHGTSCTYIWHEGELRVCSRNLELRQKPELLQCLLAERYGIKAGLEKHKVESIAIQGEICGPGINKNTLKLDHPHFFVFDIYDIKNQRYLTPQERDHLCMDLNIGHVPVLEKNCRPLGKTMDEVVKSAEGQSKFVEGQREGIVFKSCQPVNGQIISFKAINNKFLLKHGE